MFSNNPFAELSASIPIGAIQWFVALMIVLVIAGTLFDVIHKRSAQYFFENWRDSQKRGKRKVGSGEVAVMAVQTLAVEVATSAEFCNPKRRIAHLLTMYGTIAYFLATFAMVFWYPESTAATHRECVNDELCIRCPMPMRSAVCRTTPVTVRIRRLTSTGPVRPLAEE